MFVTRPSTVEGAHPRREAEEILIGPDDTGGLSDY